MICPKCGNNNITFKREQKSEVRDIKSNQTVYQTVGMCQDCGFTWVSSDDETKPAKKRNTFLWVLGWVFIFPVPLTILLLRKKNMNPVLKYGILVILWGIFLFGGANSGSSDDEDTAATPENALVLETIQEPPARTFEKPDETITADEYNNIKMGMTYEEVQTIVGCPGNIMSESGIGDTSLFIVMWHGDDFGSNANVTFNNNKVIAKAQLGIT